MLPGRLGGLGAGCCARGAGLWPPLSRNSVTWFRPVSVTQFPREMWIPRACVFGGRGGPPSILFGSAACRVPGADPTHPCRAVTTAGLFSLASATRSPFFLVRASAVSLGTMTLGHLLSWVLVFQGTFWKKGSRIKGRRKKRGREQKREEKTCVTECFSQLLFLANFLCLHLG